MKTRLFTLAALAAIAVSCSNEDGIAPQDNLKDTPITVTAGVEQLSTRAGYEGTTTLPTTFYLSMTQDTENADSKYNYTDVAMTNGGSGTSYTPADGSNLLWASYDRNSAKINAYTILGTSVSVKTDQSTAGGVDVTASDLIGAVYANADSDISISDNSIAIKFRHLLCKLNIRLSWNSEFDAVTADKKSITGVKLTGLNTTATLARATAAISAPGTEADIRAYLNGTEAEAIFAPSASATKTEFTITVTTLINGVERVFKATASAPDGFVSGNAYTVSLALGGEKVDAVTAQSKAWEDVYGDTPQDIETH